ncbi:unnamed protein product, partial [Closterium sp. Naga37s-1]
SFPPAAAGGAVHRGAARRPPRHVPRTPPRLPRHRAQGRGGRPALRLPLPLDSGGPAPGRPAQEGAEAAAAMAAAAAGNRHEGGAREGAEAGAAAAAGAGGGGRGGGSSGRAAARAHRGARLRRCPVPPAGVAPQEAPRRGLRAPHPRLPSNPWHHRASLARSPHPCVQRVCLRAHVRCRRRLLHGAARVAVAAGGRAGQRGRGCGGGGGGVGHLARAPRIRCL